MNDREQFEEYCYNKHPIGRRGEEYAHPDTRIAWAAWQAARATPAQTAVEKMLETNQLDELGHEVARLQRALCFWLPIVTDREDEVADRILQDAFLLCGIDGNIPDDFKTAQELGWISLAGGQSSPSSVGDAIRAMPLPEPTIEGSVMHPELKICYRAPTHFTADQVRAILSEAAALAEQGQGQKVPDGWKLVPIEPTNEMLHDGKLRAAFDAFDHPDTGMEIEVVNMADIWRDMLAAAPSIAQDGQKSEGA